jgi:hypothetical protein
MFSLLSPSVKEFSLAISKKGKYCLEGGFYGNDICHGFIGRFGGNIWHNFHLL